MNILFFLVLSRCLMGDRGSSWLEPDVIQYFSCSHLKASAPYLGSRNQNVLVRLVVATKRCEQEVEGKEEWVKKKRLERRSMFSSLNRAPGSVRSSASAENKITLWRESEWAERRKPTTPTLLTRLTFEPPSLFPPPEVTRRSGVTVWRKTVLSAVVSWRRAGKSWRYTSYCQNTVKDRRRRREQLNTFEVMINLFFAVQFMLLLPVHQ